MATVGWILNRNLKLTLNPKYMDFTENVLDPDVYRQVVRYPHNFDNIFDEVVNEFLSLKNAYLPVIERHAGINDLGQRYATVLVNHTIDWSVEDDFGHDGMAMATSYVINSTGTVLESTYMSMVEIRKVFDPSIKDHWDRDEIARYRKKNPLPTVNGNSIKRYIRERDSFSLKLNLNK